MEYLNSSYIISDLTSGKGYHIFPSIPNRDLEEIWKYVRISFSENFSLNYIPKKKEIINFHNLKQNQSKNINLSVLDRTLNKDFPSRLSNQKWLVKICKILDLVQQMFIALGMPLFTWRLTRPNSDNDFRPLHRDSWFRLNNKESKIIDDKKNTHIQTVKIWIALNVVLGKSGLLIAPILKNQVNQASQ